MPDFSTIKAVIFDMDGLLIDSEPIYRRAWQSAGRDLGFEISDTFYESFIGRRTVDCEQLLLNEFGRGFPLALFRDGWRNAWYHDVEQNGLPLKPGVEALISGLAERNIPVALATSTNRKLARFSLAAAGITNHFSVIVTGDEVARGKPAPDIFLKCASRSGQAPEHCLVIEDSDAGIAAAAAAGMTAVMVPDMKAPAEESLACAAAVCATLEEVAAALGVLPKQLKPPRTSSTIPRA